MSYPSKDLVGLDDFVQDYFLELLFISGRPRAFQIQCVHKCWNCIKRLWKKIKFPSCTCVYITYTNTQITNSNSKYSNSIKIVIKWIKIWFCLSTNLATLSFPAFCNFENHNKVKIVDIFCKMFLDSTRSLRRPQQPQWRSVTSKVVNIVLKRGKSKHLTKLYSTAFASGSKDRIRHKR